MLTTLIWTTVFISAANIIVAFPSTEESSEESTNKCGEESIPLCTTPGCIHAASNVLKNMDPSVDPCDDFYKFACGGFEKRTVIPDDKSLVMPFTIINDLVEQQVRAVIEEPAQPDELEAFIKLKKLYNSCLNMTAIEEDNLQTAKDLLHKLGGWPVLKGENWNEEEFDWKTTMYKYREVGMPAYSFLAMSVSVDLKNTTRRILNLDQAMVELNREYLLEGFKNDIIVAYYDYIVDIAVMFGADRETAEIELKEALQFEMKLANISLAKEERRNYTTMYNPMTVSEMQKRFPSVPWLEFINSMLASSDIEVTPDEVVIVVVPKFISDLEVLLSTTPKRVQANYAMYRVIEGSVPYLTKQLRNRELKYKAVTLGTRAMKSRQKECVEMVTTGMKVAATALYVRKYFKEEAKQNAKTLVSDLQNTFEDILKQLDWMDEETRKNALKKASAMTAHIGYPPELLDDKKLNEHFSKLKSADNYLESVLNVVKFEMDHSFKELREPVNKSDWTQHSSGVKVNAYYAPSENSIQILAGIMQGAFFDNERPHYMNYGSMGFVIGHEITHGFDDTGRQFDKDGDVSEWWAEDTKQAFMKKAQCIINQYSNYTVPEVNLNLNGINTQGENIADNGGVKEAYLAYQAWVERNGEEPRLPGLDYTPTQMFWIASANLWCSKGRKEYLRQQIMSDNHSPAYYRVLGAFSNSDFFAKDFNCPVGSRMNPEHKCQVW